MTKVLQLGVSGATEVEVAAVAGADRSVQFNSAGQLSGAAQTSIDADGNLLLTVDNVPITPSVATKVVTHIRQRANRAAPAWTDSFGLSLSAQASLVSNTFWMAAAPASGQAMILTNCVMTQSGAITLSQAYNINSRDHIATKSRTGYQTTATAGALAYAFHTTGRYLFVNSALTPVSPNLGIVFGFTCVFKINREETTPVTGARLFIGLSTNVSAPTNVAPNTLLNTFGLYKDAADTNFKLYSAGSTTGVTIDIGVNFPCNTNTDCYELVLHSPINSGRVFYEVVRTNTGDVASGEFATANLPNSVGFFAPRWWVCNNATAAASSLAVHYAYGDNPR